MYSISISNCGNIIDGLVSLKRGKLNIKYGINGTGKTTIARAIKAIGSNDLQALQSFYTTEQPRISVSPELGEVLVFNEDFVNQVVFKEDEVIENSFEIFLKTDNYEAKKARLENRLVQLREILSSDEQIRELRKLVDEVSKKFKRTNSGELSKTGMLKSIINGQDIDNIPEELTDYSCFITNRDINIGWIDWKTKGDAYDTADKCPYCSETMDRPKQDIRKRVFKTTYTKTDTQNLQEMLRFLESLQEYLAVDRYADLVECVKQNIDEARIKALFKRLMTEFDLIVDRYNALDAFGRRNIAAADISQLEQQLTRMKFVLSDYAFFASESTVAIFNRTNELVEHLAGEVATIKREMGELKGVLRATIEKSQKDINNFLKTAGINYELVIEAEDENNSKTILRQCYSETHTDVTKIREHLSWGEKNAFALILFMYYADRKNPDLIILDDPISSFDSNKKYALIHRLFKNVVGTNEVSFLGRTVLFLTHDFEPITDFAVVGKIAADKLATTFVWNEQGHLQEKEIIAGTDVKLLLTECSEIAANPDINIVGRVAFLRKLCELYAKKGTWNSVYQILSCLVHGTEIRVKIANDSYIEMEPDEKQRGLSTISQFIDNFDYDNLQQTIYTVAGIKNLYQQEENPYLKMVIFRELTELDATIHVDDQDDGWFKFIDETYHIENDNLHYLDVLKFNIVPDYIMQKVTSIVQGVV